jgi:hypothetical protein
MTEYWWNATDRILTRYWQDTDILINLSQYHLFQPKPQADCPGTEPRTPLWQTQGRIYARAKGARAQGGKFPGAAYLKKSRLKYVMRGEKKAVHEREI